MSTRERAEQQATTTAAPPTVWPALRYHDARAALRFLVDVCGFVESAVHTDDGGRVQHAELRWPNGHGAVMFGSVTPESPFAHTAGHGSMYVVCASEAEVDALHERARQAGAKIHAEPTDREYGSHEVVFADPEGNTWCFGTYPGT